MLSNRCVSALGIEVARSGPKDGTHVKPDPQGNAQKKIKKKLKKIQKMWYFFKQQTIYICKAEEKLPTVY